jgi:uncharacterized protein YcbX
MAYSKGVNPTIAALWRYPVKSMLGERCEALQVDGRGAAGDRVYAVQDPEGKLGSGKNSRVHRRIEGLFGFSASYMGEVPAISFPDGRRVLASDAGIHAALSSALRAPVTLARQEETRHYDAETIHIVTTGSLRRLGADERRFRPNLVIESETEAGDWVGRTLRIGEVSLKVGRMTGRCVMITMAQSELGDEPQLLRRLGGDEPLFGVYAEVLSAGRLALGDQVHLQ